MLAYERAGRFDESYQLLKDLHEKSRSKFGEVHPLTLKVLCNKAVNQSNRGNAEEAEQAFEQGLETAIKTLGIDNRLTEHFADRLLAHFSIYDETEKGLALRERLFRVSEAELGIEDEKTIDRYFRLAESYQLSGQPGKAKLLWPEIIQLMRAKIEGDSPPSIRLLNNVYLLAYCYKYTNQYDLAVINYERAVKLSEDLFGESNPRTIEKRASLGWAYVQSGRHKMAIDVYESILNSESSLPGKTDTVSEQHYDIATRCIEGLIEAYTAEESVDKLEVLANSTEAKFGEDAKPLLLVLKGLADIHENAGNFGLAIPTWRRLLKNRIRFEGPNHEDTLFVWRELVEAYAATEDFGEILKLVNESKVQFGEDSSQYLAATGALIETYKKTGQYDLAIQTSEELLEIRDQHFESIDNTTLNHMRELAELYRGGNLLDRAQEWLQQIWQFMKSRLAKKNQRLCIV